MCEPRPEESSCPRRYGNHCCIELQTAFYTAVILLSHNICQLAAMWARPLKFVIYIVFVQLVQHHKQASWILSVNSSFFCPLTSQAFSRICWVLPQLVTGMLYVPNIPAYIPQWLAWAQAFSSLLKHGHFSQRFCWVQSNWWVILLPLLCARGRAELLCIAVVGICFSTGSKTTIDLIRMTLKGGDTWIKRTGGQKKT